MAKRKRKTPTTIDELDVRLVKAVHALIVIEQSTRRLIQKGIDVHNELHVALWDNWHEAREALAFIKADSHDTEEES